MKEQNKTPEEVLNKMEASKLLNAEFKTLNIGMVSELGTSVHKKGHGIIKKN